MTMPGFFNQTIAGAIATGTHGSSVKHGSLSNQVIAIKAILANGTLVEISQEKHPFLIKAFRINVGRLGIVTDIKFKISPETVTRRTLRSAIPTETVMPMLKEAQETYKKTGYLPDWLEGQIMTWLPKNVTVRLFCLCREVFPILALCSSRYSLMMFQKRRNRHATMMIATN